MIVVTIKSKLIFLHEVYGRNFSEWIHNKASFCKYSKHHLSMKREQNYIQYIYDSWQKLWNHQT